MPDALASRTVITSVPPVGWEYETLKYRATRDIEPAAIEALARTTTAATATTTTLH